jgi:hypothetical protein
MKLIGDMRTGLKKRATTTGSGNGAVAHT